MAAQCNGLVFIRIISRAWLRPAPIKSYFAVTWQKLQAALNLMNLSGDPCIPGCDRTLSYIIIKLDRILERSAILNCECCKYNNDYFVAHSWTFSWLTLYCQHASCCTFVKSQGKLKICCFSVDCGIIHSSTVCTSQYSLYTSLHCCQMPVC